MPESIQQKASLLEKRVGPNSKSPLFAQLASYYLLAGRAQDALRVCDEGIANFPFYTTGHLIKAKVLIALNMSAEARRELEIVREFLPTNATVSKFLSEVPGAPGEITTQDATGARTIKPKAKVDEAPSEPAPAVEVAPEPAPPEPVASEAVQETAQSSATDMFGLTGTEAPATPEPEAPPVAEPTGAFEAVGQTPQAETTTVTMAETAEPSSPFAELEPSPPLETAAAEQPFEGLAPTTGEESFEQYSARKRAELAGQEDTMNLDDYLGGVSQTFSPPVEPEAPKPAESSNQIEELTQKLQDVKKITPVISLADKSTVTASESESPASTGFVTPTLAEIYAKQGWYDDAIKAYKTLAINKPAEREKFEKRIAELEELKKSQT